MKQKTVYVVMILAVATVLFFAYAARAEETPVKVLTDSQKLAVRDAQVKILLAAENLHATPQWKEFEAAQQKLQQVMTDVQKAVGPDYQLDNDLNLVKKPVEKK